MQEENFEVKRVRRPEDPKADYPRLFEFAKNGVKAMNREEKILIYRPRLCFVFPKEKPGCVVLAAEFCKIPPSNAPRKLFLIEFALFTDGMELLRQVQAQAVKYDVEDIYARVTPVEDDTIRAFNSSRHVQERLSINRPPYTDKEGHIAAHASILKDLMRSKRVIYREGAGFEKLLDGLPKMAPDLSDEDFPAEAAVLYLLVALYGWPTDEPGYQEKPREWSPWDILNNEGHYKNSKWSPDRFMDKFMGEGGYDPWKILKDDD